MAARWLVPLGILAVLVWVAGLCMFTVNVNDYAIVSRSGQIISTSYPPGLNFKVPFDKVAKFDKRLLSRTYSGERFLTKDSLPVLVDFYVKWRVKDPRVFFTAFSQSPLGILSGAEDRLGSTVRAGIEAAIALRTLGENIAGESPELGGDMLREVSERAAAFGVELADVRVEHLELTEEATARVFDRMKGDFEKSAAQRRAEGAQKAAAIRAEADRQRTEIIANAERDALQVRGEADALAAQTYARAYGKDPEFYAFWRSMQAYEHALGKDGDLLVVSPDGEFFRYLKDSGKAAAPRR
ncbi:MAG: protease modulator HflC [Proteobacteria bacterium]|nr:protease modulator HflC [Pseudomonadota bacterium]